MDKMSNKVRILLFTMMAGAGLIAASVFINVRGFANFEANIGQIINGQKSNSNDSFGADQTETLATKSDIDQDGLFDEEEPIYGTDPLNPDTDGDGFLDGEEVASGRYPTKPGPDDPILTKDNPKTINITDKISTLMASGFYAGDLSGNADPATYNKALADISVELMIDGMQALNPNNISTSQTIFSSDSKEAQEKYINTIGSIIQIDLWGELVNEPRVAAFKFANFNTEDPQNIADSRRYFDSKTNYYKRVIKKVNAVTVPPSWLDVHRQILSSLQKLAINQQALSQTIDDPLKGILAMNNLMSVYQDVHPILVTIMRKIKENNLNPPNGQLWNLVNSLIDDF